MTTLKQEIDEIMDEFQAQIQDGYTQPVNGWTTLKQEAAQSILATIRKHLPEKFTEEQITYGVETTNQRVIDNRIGFNECLAKITKLLEEG